MPIKWGEVIPNGNKSIKLVKVIATYVL